MFETSLFLRDGDSTYELSEAKEDPNGWVFWLKNKDGEGVGLSRKSLFDMFDKYFKEYF